MLKIERKKINHLYKIDLIKNDSNVIVPKFTNIHMNNVDHHDANTCIILDCPHQDGILQPTVIACTIPETQ